MSTTPSGIVAALFRRWWLVAGTPLATAVLALAFVLLVTPQFRVATSVRIVAEEEPLAGAVPTGAGEGVGGLSFLASLTGRGVPLQTEMAVLSSRRLTERLVEDMGLRVEVREPSRVPRSEVLARAALPLDGPEGDLELRRQSDGRFSVAARLLTSRDPFRVVGETRYEPRDLGTVGPGEAIALDGAQLLLSEGAGRYERIVIRLLPRDRALRRFQSRLTVTRPERDADVVEVALTWPDPYVAAEAANRLVDGYLAYREQLRVEQARRSSAFLSAQLDSLDSELKTAEEELRRFRETRDVVAPEAQVSAEVQRLAELKGRRDLLQAERTALSDLVASLDASGGGRERRLVFFPTLLQSQSTAELLRLLGELENERAKLLDRRTADAREVALVTARIEEIESELKTVAQTYLEGLGDQVAALDRTLSGSEAALGAVPQVEMEYVRRRRQVELLTELETFLQTRRKEAELTAAKRGVGAYILGEARPPQEPATPRPTLTVALALVVGLVLGVGAALVLERPAPAPAAD